MAKGEIRQVVGPSRNRRGRYQCGMCGVKTTMTKAHIPPRCAGNEMLVKRYRFVVNGYEADAGRGDIGGIHMYGLCKRCNGRASRYDAAYGKFAQVSMDS